MIASALAGAIFGIGLMISGMTDTTRVQGWLDIFGDWDPTLAFVLGGAIVPMAVAWRLTRVVASPILGASFPPPPAGMPDRNLVIGSTLFGAGWGLTGLCPGPALASLAWGGTGGALFLLSMAAGMVATPPLRRRLLPV